ncbi:hypothetical protein HMPREF9597_00772 [Cutibacterium acnes HL005PA4]|nr:hypothetical protein HMPREF9585_00977 [Cutibacterium acnes HL083PA1]EFS79863.1 hypothetical protein HMPREF9597_00772 [Cutibacterium acnes HL005PA4]EFT54663.1 hypothetical protein HMPREF9610_02261 [Cutibacterium acnes HL027PA2]EGF72054.1 hypothetical protein HMPREF9563_00346 [Cutibacterium acnes HL020PA1]
MSDLWKTVPTRRRAPVDNPGHHDSLYNRGHGSLFGTASSQRLIRMADCRTCGPR